MPIDPAIYREMGLNDSEYALIVETLGREPTYTEIGMYSVMWSEHCGYKYSRPVLKAFAEYKKAQETGALENAGVVPLGDTGYGVVFKMESHNHPSAVEPFQGAATGVGGILRDIFTMGARPVAILDSLRFGPIVKENENTDDATITRNKYLFDGVVSGISHYTNCLAGEETFIWHDADGLHKDTIGNFVETHFTSERNFVHGCDTLSFDIKTGSSCWSPISRVFRRRVTELLTIRTRENQCLTVTPDHPMIVGEIGSNVLHHRVCFAHALKKGDLIYVFEDINAAITEATNCRADRSRDEEGNFLPLARTLPITHIERVSVPEGVFVYDVEVIGTHLFVTSGGIITHNCVGVPNAGGEIYFHPCYNGNPLVNAMAVGVVKVDNIASAKAKGVGNPVLYVGSATGRDGIHGATFASVELSEESEAKRPNVQVGDPFTEKLLIEATIEALATGHIVAIQDMGAAGLTCGTCEMAAKGGLGMEIDVQNVPRRETGMTAYETMLSESQERMLAVVAKGHEAAVAAVFHKWGLNAAYIGVTTDNGRVIVRDSDLPTVSSFVNACVLRECGCRCSGEVAR